MNISKVVVILLSVLMTVTFAQSSAYAGRPIKNNSTGTQLLVGNLHKEFSAYMSKNAPKFANSTEFAKFNTVVSLYDSTPENVINLNIVSRQEFNQSVAAITAQLGKLHTAEAKRWSGHVEDTAKALGFIWSFQVETPTVEETPVMVTNTIAL